MEEFWSLTSSTRPPLKSYPIPNWQLQRQQYYMSLMIKFINPLSPNPQNGQTHSNNSSGNETSGLSRSIIRKPVNKFNLNIDWLVSLWLTLILHNEIHYSVKKQILTLIFIFVYTIYINHICLPQFIDLSIYN